MELNKKYCNLIDSDSGYDNQLLADCCENIADEFAIGFAEWCKQEYDVENTAFHNKWLDVDGKYVSTKELLEIYKKEKGL